MMADNGQFSASTKPEAADLVVRCYARWSARTLVRGGRSFEPRPGQPLPDDVVLEKPPLPSQASWKDAIARAGELSGPGCVVVKRLKPQQDKRFDLPTVGAGTIEAMAKAGASCLVIEAGASLVFDKPAMIAAADQAGICLMARREQNL